MVTGVTSNVQNFKKMASEQEMEFQRLWKTYSSHDCPSNPMYCGMMNWAEESPNENCITWFDASGEPTVTFTRLELFNAVRKTALYFTEALDLKIGDKVILCYPPEVEFNIVFLACICSGIVAVPVYPPDSSRAVQDIERFVRIKQTVGVTIALTTSTYKKAAILLGAKTRNSEWKRVKWICTNDININNIDSLKFVPPELESKTLAFLQFTSGSTSAPKGVMVTHGSLLHNMHLNLRGIDICSSIEDPTTKISFSSIPYHEYWDGIRRRNELSRRVLGHGVRIFTWLPAYHDMGLIGAFCAPIFFGLSMCMMSPTVFIRKPYLWLKLISTYQCVATAAPNFAYELVCRKIPDDVYEKLDLKYTSAFLCGAEPIRASTLKKFTEKFAPKGMHQSALLSAYGLAENTLSVCGRNNFCTIGKILKVKKEKLQLGEVEVVHTYNSLTCDVAETNDFKYVVSCGIPYAGVDVRVVEPHTCKELSDGYQGEIWIRSPSVAEGYCNMPDETKRTFQRKCTFLNGEVSTPVFLRTGDLGFVMDGEVYITSRMKDILIIRGRKYYPQDIEKAVEDCSEVRPGCVAAFSLDIRGEEVLCILAEVRTMPQKGVARLVPGMSKRRNGKKYEKISKSIVAAVSYSFRLQVHTVCLLPKRCIPKTTSGKIQRSLSKERLLKGEFYSLLYISKPLEIPQSQALAPHIIQSVAAEQSQEALKESKIEPIVSSSVFKVRTAIKANKSTELEADIYFKRDIMNTVTEVVKQSAVEVLGITEDVDQDAPLIDLGIDSLSAVEISESLSIALDVEIDATLLFEYPTVRHLTAFLVELIGAKNKKKIAQSVGDRIISASANKDNAAINIVGTSCRLPGACNSIDDLWELLLENRDAICQVPYSRWNVSKTYDPDPEAEGKMYIKEGGFINEVDVFDAEFFKISSTDAKSMDPQQRLLLEVSYEALNNAGFNKIIEQRANIGMFVGCCSNDWSRICIAAGDRITASSAISHAPSILSNRVSFALGMVGPSVTVDTACSSALVAMHMAVLEMKSECCDAAVVAGVNLILSPSVTIAFCKAGMMAPDARCKTFDARANGFVRSEGVIATVLQREDAKKKATSLAVIRGSAINHGGKAACLTAPISSGQVAVIKLALKRASLQPSDIDVIEAHGTGTTLGDPIEVSALKTVYASSKTEKNPLILGALKTNLGHMEGASGLAGILKAILMIQHNVVPKILHLKELNGKINISNFSVLFPTANTAVPVVSHNHNIKVGVSSFGFGGSNAHVIIENSANFVEISNSENFVKAPKVAFLFTGQGSQYSKMGQKLFETETVFRNALTDCAAITDEKLSFPLLHILYPSMFVEHDLISKYENLMDTAEFSQPAIFAIEYSVACLLESKGVRADAVLGHSFGEYAAAVFSGIISLKDGLKLVLERSRQTADTPSQNGVMVALRLSPEQAEVAIKKSKSDSDLSIYIAAYNGPRSVVLSGVSDEVNKFLKEHSFVDSCKFLNVTHAFHSPLMAPVVNAMKNIAKDIEYKKSRIAYVSGCTGKIADFELKSAEYWSEHIAHPVKFMQGMQTLEEQGIDVFVEVGPQQILTTMGRHCVNNAESHTWFNILLKNESRIALDFSETIKQLQCQQRGFSRVEWKHTKYPLKTSVKSYFFFENDLVPTRKGNKLYYDVVVPIVSHKILLDHVINELPIMPAAAFIELALSILNLWTEKSVCSDVFQISNVEILQPLILPNIDEALKLTIVVEDSGEFAVESIENDATVAHFQGSFCNSPANLSPPDFNVVRQRVQESVSVDTFYTQLHKKGLKYGSKFQCIQELIKDGTEVIAKISSVSIHEDEEEFFLHPSLLDSAFQSTAAALVHHNANGVFVPAAIDSVVASKIPASELWSYVNLKSMDMNNIIVDIHLYNSTFLPVASLKKLCLRRFNTLPIEKIPSDFLWKVDWQQHHDQQISSKPYSVYQEIDQLRVSETKISNSILVCLPRSLLPHVSLNSNAIVTENDLAIEHTLESIILSKSFDWMIYFGSINQCLPSVICIQHVITLLQACHSINSKRRDFCFPTLVIFTYGAQVIANEKMLYRPFHAGMLGLVRAARFELDVIGQIMSIVYVDLDPTIDIRNGDAILKDVCSLLKQLQENPKENEIAIRNQTYFFSKLCSSELICHGPIQLYMKSRGALSNLQLKPLSQASRCVPTGNQCELRVRAIGLNFRDVLNVMGLYPGDPGLPGADVAGTVIAVGENCPYKVGDNVFGLAAGCIKSYVSTSSDLLAPMPKNVSFEAAAAFPVVAVTVELALGDLAKVKAGENVLIHAASGGVGLTAIQFCKRVGANIFGTVSSEEKRLFIEAMGVKVIASSRDVKKFKSVMQGAIKNYGPIHVVLNCLTDDFIPESLQLLAEGGRFMELGKRGILNSDEVQAVRPDVYYEAIAVDTMAQENPVWFGNMLKRVSQYVEAGQIQCLPIKIYNMYEAGEGIEAFRFLQRAKHIGKVVISIPSCLNTKKRLDESELLNKKTYIITGGIGGLGRVVARWLIEEGAKHLVLLSRRGYEAISKEQCIVQWLSNLSNSVKVTAIKCDVSNKDEVLKVFSQIYNLHMPPVRGVFHAAGVLQDAEFYKQHFNMIKSVYSPKVNGAWNIHDVCEELHLNEEMEVFMMFSSITALIGNIGQTTYAAANSCLDALVQYRKSMGLCGQSIQWGPWIEQGMATGFKNHLIKAGMHGISNELAFRVLGDMMRKSELTVVGCQEFKWNTFIKRFSYVPLFYSNITSKLLIEKITPSSDASLEIISKSKHELAELLVSIAKETCTSNSSNIVVDIPLMEVDLDSLGIMEFRNVVYNKTGVKPPQTLLFENPTMLDIADYILKKLKNEASDSNIDAETLRNHLTSDYKVHGMTDRLLSKTDVSTRESSMSNTRETLDSRLQHPLCENNSHLDEPIGNWLRTALSDESLYAKYLNSFCCKYVTVRELASLPDLSAALDMLNVTDFSDRSILINAIENLRASNGYNTNAALLNANDNHSRTSTAIGASVSDSGYLITHSTLPASPLPVYSTLVTQSNVNISSLSQDHSCNSQPIDDVELVIKALRFNVVALKKPCPINKIQRVLLTGATGFIGCLQLVTLLKRQSSPKLLVYCIVRGSTNEHAIKRIQNACEIACCWQPEFRSRIVPVLGDLKLERFGLNEVDFKKLCQDIDLVYHNAADINLFKSYARIREVNVLSLKNILTLTSTYKLKPLHYTSTLGMFPAYFANFQKEYANVEVTENCLPKETEMQFFPITRMGYPWSKWAGELILTKAKSMGLPVTIYRLPVTCMAYETGYTHADNLHTQLMSAVLQEGLMPYGFVFHGLSAADVICNLLVELSLAKTRKHWIYHLVDTRVAVRHHFVQWFNELGLTVSSVTVEEFINTVKNRGLDSPFIQFIPMIQLWRHYWFADKERCEPQPISTHNILDDLPHRISPWPPIHEIFQKSFFYNVRHGMYHKFSEPLKINVQLYFENHCVKTNLGILSDASFFLKPANLLYNEINQSEAKFAGKFFSYRLIKQMLDNAVFLENKYLSYPQMRNASIKKAIFIVGLDRMSTTLMQWLLAQDSANRTPRFCEMLLPYGAEGNYKPHDVNVHSWEQDPRVPAAQDILSGLSMFSDGAPFEELLRADSPFDDSVIFEQFGRSHTISILVNAPEYQKWLNELTDEDMDVVYEHHKRFLQHLQWQKPGERWVLNSAFHLFSLGSLFKTYPDATVIWIHRDPKQVVKSWCQFSSRFKNMLYESVDRKNSDKATTKIASTLLAKALAYRESNFYTENRIIDVQHDSFIHDPLGTVKRVYKACGLTLSAKASKAMKLFLLDHRHLRRILLAAPAFGFGHGCENEPVNLSDKELATEFHSYNCCRYLQASKSSPGTAGFNIDQIVAGAAAMLFRSSNNKKNKLQRHKTVNETANNGGRLSIVSVGKSNLFSFKNCSSYTSNVPRLKTM